MQYKLDTEIDLKNEISCNYIISSQHRQTGNPQKSIWKITYKEEVQCFIQAIDCNWKSDSTAWGIKLKDASLQVIGHNNNGQDLKVAKFVDGSNNNVWHGYPADHMNKAHDRPTTTVLKDWVQKGYLTKAKMSKIRQGQSCSL